MAITKPCGLSPMKTFKIIGLVGLLITIVMNLLALLVFKRAAAVYFSTEWWSTWFPSYTVWLVFTIMGLAYCFGSKRFRTDDK
jgi:hypothetical protein